MGRNPLPESEKKRLFNAKIPPATYERMQVICFRKSIHRMKKFSEGELTTININKTPMPKPPTQAQIRAYIEKYPQHRDSVLEMSAHPWPQKTKQNFQPV